MSFFGFFEYMNNIVWGIPMIVLLLGVHLYFTIKTRFIQRYLITGIRITKSSFGTLSATLAATLGTGNILGVASAIALGGAGAVFWCWITGLFGMATSYAECYLGIKYRVKHKDGTYSGGPMYVLSKGMNNEFLAVIFSVSMMFATFGVGCTTQSGAIKSVMCKSTDINPHIVGIVLAVLAGSVIIGGFKSIERITGGLVPTMAILYIGGSLVLLFINYRYIFEAVILIIRDAFGARAVLGGIGGAGINKALRYGVARGLFTNEAGLGSAPVAAAQTNIDIKEQSIISMTATFWDTVVMCAITGIVIISSMLSLKEGVYENIPDELLVAVAFSQIQSVGGAILNISLVLFAFATLIAWSYFGEKAFCYVFGKKYVGTYRIVYIVMIYVGTVVSMENIWQMCDFFNAMMALPNIIALIVLRNEIK